MSRRSRIGRFASTDPTVRSTFSEVHMADACNAINKCCSAEIDMMVPQRFNREQVLPWLFPADALHKLRAVKGMVSTDGLKNYEIGNEETTLQITYSTTGRERPSSTPAIEPEVMKIDFDAAFPLIAAVARITEIHEKYGRVKHMLRWMNRNATEGAVRTYWPAAMSLCPQSSVAQMVVPPSRYNIPPGLSDVLPLIRETAGTVAAMQLVPKDTPDKPHINLRLTLHGRKRMWEGIEIELDTQTFNL